MFFWLYYPFLFWLLLILWVGKAQIDSLIVEKGDWQGHSNNERAVWEGGREDRDYLTFGIRSYLTVGLLFGLTLPGVSAHGFLRGGGWGKGLYSSKTIQGILRKTDKDGQRKKEGEAERKKEK